LLKEGYTSQRPSNKGPKTEREKLLVLEKESCENSYKGVDPQQWWMLTLLSKSMEKNSTKNSGRMEVKIYPKPRDKRRNVTGESNNLNGSTRIQGGVQKEREGGVTKKSRRWQSH